VGREGRRCNLYPALATQADCVRSRIEGACRGGQMAESTRPCAVGNPLSVGWVLDYYVRERRNMSVRGWNQSQREL
jgi:hypothetical protein